MKTHCIIAPLSIMVVLTACDLDKTASNADKNKDNAPKTVREVRIFDNGAVVPMPDTRRLSFVLKDSTSVLLTYLSFRNGGKDSTKQEVILRDEASDAAQDFAENLSDIADGTEIKPGKFPCVGVSNLDVSVIFSTGDTTQFTISGSARCDRSLFPDVWSLDSLANAAVKNAPRK